MEQHHTIHAIRQSVGKARSNGSTVGVVPTMGNLHEGHLSLIDRALSMTDFVVCTLFVNPMQFGAGEDLDNYPRTLDQDRERLQQHGCHCLFAPPASEVYPEGLQSHTTVTVPALSERHCGAGRPGHFDGVATVVTKLFNIVQPDVAIFGQKDYQQLQVIRKLTRDLCLPVTISSAPTLREPNGLAMSSRNGYLSQEQKDRAAVLYRSLQQSATRIGEESAVDFPAIESTAMEQIREAGLEPEYVAVCDATTLQPATAESRELVILTAARIGSTRLIDNITLVR
ncbi:MAG: pantoate--beta-alanine ligase [Pseudohongiellaceae bacterium]